MPTNTLLLQMTYNAEVQFKFDSTWTPTYSGFGSTVDNDFLPEEHYVITAPAADRRRRVCARLPGRRPRALRSVVGSRGSRRLRRRVAP